MTSTESLFRAFANGLDGSARVRMRRPGTLFQVELPAFMGDGDVAALYVRPRAGDRLVLTDLGSTRARVGQTRRLTGDVDDELREMALRHGIAFENGELRVEVSERDLLSASLGLLQVEAQAERLAEAPKRRSHDAVQFREEVLALLHTLFREKIEEPFFDKKSDPEALFKVDALVMAKTPLAVAVVPGEVEAERAVSAKLALHDKAPAKTRWIAIPRDMERLTSSARKRLTREYFTAGSAFAEDREVVQNRLRDLADVA